MQSRRAPFEVAPGRKRGFLLIANKTAPVAEADTSAVGDVGLRRYGARQGGGGRIADNCCRGMRKIVNIVGA
jgi:hypothetical protein